MKKLKTYLKVETGEVHTLSDPPTGNIYLLYTILYARTQGVQKIW